MLYTPKQLNLMCGWENQAGDLIVELSVSAYSVTLLKCREWSDLLCTCLLHLINLFASKGNASTHRADAFLSQCSCVKCIQNVQLCHHINVCFAAFVSIQNLHNVMRYNDLYSAVSLRCLNWIFPWRHVTYLPVFFVASIQNRHGPRQIREIEGCACAGNAENVFPAKAG